MPTHTWPSPLFPTTGISASYWTDTILHDTTNPEDSLYVINGNLDEENVDAGFTVYAEHTQKGSHVRVHQAARTVDLDYFDGSFAAKSSGTVDSDTSHVIPGCAVRWYQPWVGPVLFMWSVGWGNNADADTEISALFLTLDGTVEDDTRRNLRRSIPTGGTIQNGGACNRVYSGHWFEPDMSVGYHDAALIVACNGPPHTRLYSGHIIAVPFNVTLS